MGLGIIGVPFLQARHRGNIEGNYELAMSCLVYRKFPAGSIPRWRAIFFLRLIEMAAAFGARLLGAALVMKKHPDSVASVHIAVPGVYKKSTRISPA
ncbi:MAG TPA: hypothetical protein VJZ77_17115 [Blastocatellia bacterium]|nr:hypothetical protein [Blastocatellia bacterium]